MAGRTARNTGRPGAGNRSAAADGKADRGADRDADRDPAAKARDICLRLLTVRARTRSELADALRSKGIDADVAEQVLGRLDAVGLVDDADFAEMWVRSRHTYQGLGRRALAAELHRKGVPAEIAAEAVSSVDSESEEQRARELVRKRLGALRGLDDAVRLRRLLGLLARKGYSQGLAYRVVRDELRAAGEEAELLDGDAY